MMKLKEMGGGGGGGRSCGSGVWGVDLGGGEEFFKELKKMVVMRVKVEEGGDGEIRGGGEVGGGWRWLWWVVHWS